MMSMLYNFLLTVLGALLGLAFAFAFALATKPRLRRMLFDTEDDND